MSNYDVSEQATTYTMRCRPDWGQAGTAFDITMDQIVSLSLDITCFSSTSGESTRVFPLSLGQANSSELNAVVLSSAGTISRNNVIHVKINGTSFGAFRVDKVIKNEEEGTVTVHGFDKMADTERVSVTKATESNPLGSNPTDIQVLNALCTVFNFTLDSTVTNTVTKAYKIRNTYHNVKCREMFAQIAAAYGGAFYLWTDDYENVYLCFVDAIIPAENDSEPRLKGTGVNINDYTSPVYYVAVFAANDNTYVKQSQNPTGNVWIEVNVPWAVQAVADNLLTKYDGVRYRGFTARDCIIDEYLKLSDVVRINGQRLPVYGIHINAGPVFLADLSAPETVL